MKCEIYFVQQQESKKWGLILFRVIFFVGEILFYIYDENDLCILDFFSLCYSFFYLLGIYLYRFNTVWITFFFLIYVRVDIFHRVYS